MCILFIALLLQQQQPPPKFALPNAPTTVTKQATESHPEAAPQLRKTGNVTTPQLNQNSPETPYEMGRDIGGQAESIGELREGVRDLRDKRDRIDRPDIDSLKGSRTHAYWLISFIAGVGSLLFFVWRAIWREMIKPRIVNALSDSMK